MARQKDKDAVNEVRILSRIKEALEEGNPVRSLDFTEEDQKYVNQAQLLTSKEMLYIANVGEDEIGDEDNEKFKLFVNMLIRKVRKSLSSVLKLKKKLLHWMMMIEQCS